MEQEGFGPCTRPGEIANTMSWESDEMKRWRALSETAKLSIKLTSLLAVQLLLFAFPVTPIMIGSIIPIDPFHPWIIQFLLVVLTGFLLGLSLLAWLIHIRNGRAVNRSNSLKAS